MSISSLAGPTQASLPRSQLPGTQQSTPSPKSSAAAPPPATRLQRETAIAAFKNSADIQIERLQVILDGATDAVLQTQDVTALAQSVKLANSKRVTVSDLLCDAIMYVALQGVAQVVKGTIQGLAESTAEGFLSTNTAFRLLPLSEQGQSLSSDQIQAALNTIGEANADGKKWLIYSDAVRNAIQQGSDKAAEALADLTKSTLSGEGGELGLSLGPKESVAGTDQPRTAITRSVQSYVAMHRLAIRIEMNNLEASLRTGPFTASQLDDLTSALAVQAPPDDLDSLRAKYSLLIEACIWSKLYQLDSGNPVATRIYHASGTDTGDPALPGGGNMKGVPGAIVQYWWSRFTGFGNVPDETGMEQTIQVCKLFLDVGSNLNDAIQQLSSSSVIQVSGQ